MRSESVKKRRVAKGNRRWIVLGIASLILLGAFFYIVGTSYFGGAPEYPINWQARLSIFDARSNMNLTIPIGIGVAGQIWNNHTLDSFGPPGYAPISTRTGPNSDGTETIFIQSNTVRFYYIGDFFNVWGKPISRSCVTAANYCADPAHNIPPPFITDGNAEFCLSPQILFENYLSKGLEWEIIIGSQGVPGFNPSQCA